MNFIEAVKLFQLDKNIKLMRRSNEIAVSLHPLGEYFMKDDSYSIYLTTVDDILANDWYAIKREILYPFEEALKTMKEGAKIRFISWESDVYISLQAHDVNSKMTDPYIYVTSRYGQVPWIPTQIEIMSDQWEIKEETK